MAAMMDPRWERHYDWLRRGLKYSTGDNWQLICGSVASAYPHLTSLLDPHLTHTYNSNIYSHGSCYWTLLCFHTVGFIFWWSKVSELSDTSHVLHQCVLLQIWQRLLSTEQQSSHGLTGLPHCCKLFTENFEARALSSAPSPLSTLLGYVDDTFVDSFMRHINSINPSIQFTTEPAVDDKLPFLATLVILQEDGTLRTQVYWKPKHTDQYQ